MLYSTLLTAAPSAVLISALLSGLPSALPSAQYPKGLFTSLRFAHEKICSLPVGLDHRERTAFYCNTHNGGLIMPRNAPLGVGVVKRELASFSVATFLYLACVSALQCPFAATVNLFTEPLLFVVVIVFPSFPSEAV